MSVAAFKRTEVIAEFNQAPCENLQSADSQMRNATLNWRNVVEKLLKNYLFMYIPMLSNIYNINQLQLIIDKY